MINLVLAAALMTAASMTAPNAASPFLWEKRVIVIRTDKPINARFQQQRRALLDDRDALRERDLVVFAVFGDGSIEAVFGPAPTASTAKPIVQMLAKDGDFQIALIGKDGGVKTSSATPLALETLIELIDAMPMRREERRK